MALRFDSGASLGEPTRTPQGGLRVPANLTRVGVFYYKDTEGNVFGELRPPEEVFDPESIASMCGAPVTVGHHGLVTSDNYASVNKGTVADNVQRDGIYLAATLIVQDADAVSRIEEKTLRDVSAGYRCQLDETPGVFEGSAYQRIQRQIRYNHAALLSKGEGRAGTDVSLRLDGAAYEITTPEEPMKTITFKGRVYRCDSAEDMAALQTDLASQPEPKADAEAPMPPAAEPALNAQISEQLQALQKGMTDVIAGLAQLQASIAAEEAAEAGRLAASAPASSPEAAAEPGPSEEEILDAKVEARVRLRQDAASVLGDVDLKGKKPREIHELVLAKLAPGERMDGMDELAVATLYRGALAAHKTASASSQATAEAAARSAEARADTKAALASLMVPAAAPFEQKSGGETAEQFRARLIEQGRAPIGTNNITGAPGKV